MAFHLFERSPMKLKKLPLAELQEAARVATQISLSSRTPLGQSVRDALTLGTRWDGDAVIFELYIAGAKPADAIVLTETRVNLYDGRIEAVHIHDGAWASVELGN